MSNRELVKPYESESADLPSNIRIFDKLVVNIRCQTPVCQTQIGISVYFSNPNLGFGSRIFDLGITAEKLATDVSWIWARRTWQMATALVPQQTPHWRQNYLQRLRRIRTLSEVVMWNWCFVFEPIPEFEDKHLERILREHVEMKTTL